MKILFISYWLHPKNLNALMNYGSIDFTTINTVADMDSFDISLFDFVYSPSQPIDISKYPNTYFIFGPHFSVFPDDKINCIQSNKSLFIVPSKWCIDFWKKDQLCKDLNMGSCPFGVDTILFNEVKHIQNRDKVFIYFKSRRPEELAFVEKLLISRGIIYKVFNYDTRYEQNEYLEYLQESKYGIWIGRHESQGFALEEALSCNVPLLVWDCKSMNQEHGQNYPDIPATVIPYFDERCGEYFYDANDFQGKMDLFINNIDTYRPREYVVENLSMEVCEKRMITSLCNFKNKNICI